MPQTDVDANPHIGQLYVVARRKRFNHVRCHRRFGKSVLAYNLLAETALEGAPVAFCMPTAVEYAKRYAELVQGLSPLIDDHRVSDGVITMKGTRGRGRIECFGLHRFDSMRGNHYARVVVDEAAHSPYLEEAWNYVIRPTLADLKGDAYLMSTPNGGNYFKQLEDANSGRPDWSCIHIPVTSPYRNPSLDQDEIDEQQRTLPSIVWQQEWMAEYVDIAGARVQREWLRWFDTNPLDLTIHMGVDLAISTKTEADYTSCAVVGKAPDGVLYTLDVQRTKQSYHGILNFIQAMYDRWKPGSICVESVQFQQAVVEELLLRGLPVRGVKPDRDKVSRFIVTEGKIEHGMLKFNRHLPNEFIDELLSFPVGNHDDMVDALVYAVDAHKSGFWVAI